MLPCQNLAVYFFFIPFFPRPHVAGVDSVFIHSCCALVPASKTARGGSDPRYCGCVYMYMYTEL